MLHKLVEYADSQGISGVEGYRSKRIRFLFQFSPQGEYLSLRDYGKNGEEFANVPHLQFAGDKPYRQFLVDTIDFLTCYPAEFAAFKRETDKRLTVLKKENDYTEIKAFADKNLSLLFENNYSAFRETGSVEAWTKILKREGRNNAIINAFLGNGGAISNILNSEKFKLVSAIERLEKATNDLLNGLQQEGDFEEMRSFSEAIMIMLTEKRFLDLREGEFEKKWKKLLIKRRRGAREDIQEFFLKKGVVEAVFSNEEFKLVGKHQFCLRLLEQAAEAEPLLGIIAKAMSDQAALRRIHNDLAEVKPAATSTNNATFAVIDSNGAQILVNKQSWRSWWTAKRSEFSREPSAGGFRCFLSGQQTTPTLTHPKITGLGSVGGNAETSLVSFDKGSMSFQSYGFIQGENAAISAGSAVKYSSAINSLLSRQHHRLAGSEVIYWYSHDLSENEDIIKKAFAGLGAFEEDDDQEEDAGQREAQAIIDAKEFLRSVAAGERRDLRNVQYCSLTLQGNQGRAVIHNWMEGRFVDLAENIKQWFFNLELPRITGIGFAKPPKIETLITCLLKEKKREQEYADWVKPVSGFRDAIWRAAIGGSKVPFPENTVRLALLRLRESTLTDEWANALDPNGGKTAMWRRARLYARIGLIKAFLIRNTKQEVDMEDSEGNRNSVYWLGSVFAVLADLQRSAHQSDGGENVKATIVDRFYTTASTCPKLVYGRLIAQSQHHLRKLENKNQNAANAINREIAAINQKIDFDEVPDMLPLPEQSWFALGYYRQIASMNRRRAEAAATKKANLKKGE